MTWRDLRASFAAWSAAGEPLVLATVYGTEGSTYSKAGARMLITGDGRFRGMLSGGCLEGDLALRAQAVLASGRPQCVTYDLRSGEDGDVFGLGVGCEGLMRVFLQPLTPERHYEPFAAMLRVLAGDTTGCAVTVLSTGTEPAAGATAVFAGDETEWLDFPREWREPARRAAADALAAGRSRATTPGTDGVELLCGLLEPPPRVLVLGAGPDARPVVRLAAELGWRVTVQDHRPAYIAQGGLEDAESVLCLPAQALGGSLDWRRYAAAIVMSHHLETDRRYLAQLAATDIPYVGLLGPRHRRERLLRALGGAAASLEPRLHGPAGLDLGGEGPAAIALSIVAETHAPIAGRHPAGSTRG
jgi:xanthine/CO dehydrogenase XdhC/CoxF family maturation factor